MFEKSGQETLGVALERQKTASKGGEIWVARERWVTVPVQLKSAPCGLTAVEVKQDTEDENLHYQVLTVSSSLSCWVPYWVIHKK